MRRLTLAAAPLALVGSAILGLALVAGCGRHSSMSKSKTEEEDAKPLKVVAQLQCPEHQGSLTRVRTSPDGLSCDYAGPKGAEVTLRLIKLTAGQKPEDVLTPLEMTLNTLMPGLSAKLAQGEAASKAHDADRAEAEAHVADRKAAAAEAKAEGSERGRKGDNVNVDMPGVHVKTKGDDAKVNLPGLHVDANDKGAHIDIGGMHINADGKDGDGSANVQISSDREDVTVRAQDHAAEVRTRKHGSGLRATYVLKDENVAEGGWRMVGYEAWGPETGPVVAAVVKGHDVHDERIFRAAKALVKSNVGG
jgi:hypothetical protein